MAADNVGVDNAGAKELTGSVAHQWSPLLRPLVAGRTSIGVWGAAAASVGIREAVVGSMNGARDDEGDEMVPSL